MNKRLGRSKGSYKTRLNPFDNHYINIPTREYEKLVRKFEAIKQLDNQKNEFKPFLIDTKDSERLLNYLIELRGYLNKLISLEIQKISILHEDYGRN
jgi:hypothetical protein